MFSSSIGKRNESFQNDSRRNNVVARVCRHVVQEYLQWTLEIGKYSWSVKQKLQVWGEVHVE
jgi:hypothetical protein